MAARPHPFLPRPALLALAAATILGAGPRAGGAGHAPRFMPPVKPPEKLMLHEGASWPASDYGRRIARAMAWRELQTNTRSGDQSFPPEEFRAPLPLPGGPYVPPWEDPPGAWRNLDGILGNPR